MYSVTEVKPFDDGATQVVLADNLSLFWADETERGTDGTVSTRTGREMGEAVLLPTRLTDTTETVNVAPGTQGITPVQLVAGALTE